METSVLTEIIPIKWLQIRPITVITNTLNSLNAIYSLEHSPLKDIVINPVSEPNLMLQIPENLAYKTCVSESKNFFYFFYILKCFVTFCTGFIRRHSTSNIKLVVSAVYQFECNEHLFTRWCSWNRKDSSDSQLSFAVGVW